MKKILALVLVLCMVLGLVACTKPADQDPEITTTPTTGETSFAGKTLQIWGKGTDSSYTDYEAFGKGNYLWMMKAAIVEWAEMNGVTVKFCGAYNQNAILAAMASGEKPDIIFQTNNFPVVANYGIVQAWTEEEYNTLVELTGDKQYMDMLNYKGKSYGFVYPWSGNMMLYFNKSMFERYDVKSPLDYFNEGTWNWDNFQKCLKAMTRDLDGDGTSDTYGMNNDSWGAMVNPNRMDEQGRVLNTIDDPWIQDFFGIKYNAFSIDKSSCPGGIKIQSNVTYPMWAMQMSDCEPYNYEHMFQVLPNGDEIMVVPLPKWTGADGAEKEWLKWTQSAGHIAASCDEREAAFDLICYLIKCGMKYISDFSLGTVKCDYAGIQGTSDLSKQWKEAFAKVIEDRQAGIKELEHYDAAHQAKVNAYFAEIDEWYAYAAYGGITNLLSYAEITKMPPASSIPAIREKYQASLDKYNELYVFAD